MRRRRLEPSFAGLGAGWRAEAGGWHIRGPLLAAEKGAGTLGYVVLDWGVEEGKSKDYTSSALSGQVCL